MIGPGLGECLSGPLSILDEGPFCSLGRGWGVGRATAGNASQGLGSSLLHPGLTSRPLQSLETWEVVC